MVRFITVDIMLILLGLSAFSCGRASPRPAATAVVQFSEQTNSSATASLRQDASAELVTSLPEANAEVWRIDPESLPALQQDRRVTFLERMPQAAITAVPAASVALEGLATGDQSMIRRLTAGIAPSEFRITGARPPALSADLLASQEQRLFTIPLLATVSPLFRRQQVTRAENGDLTWRGTPVEGQGDALLVIRERGVTGQIRFGGQTFSILPLPEGRQLIRREPQVETAPDHPPDFPEGALPPSGTANFDEAPAKCSPPDKDVDVLVVLSKDVTTQLQDPSGLAKLAIEQTNRSFQNSNILVRVALKDTVALPYDEAPRIETDVTAMRDGKIPGLRQARDRTASDIVMMLVSHQDDGGLSAAILAKRNDAFAAVSIRYAVANKAFAHELGHLFGARHDRAVDKKDTPFKFGHGYVLTNEWRTIMAYENGCNCSREEIWSDSGIRRPDSKGMPQTTVIRDISEDARVIRQTGEMVAQFRCRTT